MQESLTDRDADFSVKGVEKLSSSSSNEELHSQQQEDAGPSTSRDEQMEDVHEQAFNSLLNATVEWDQDDDDEDQTCTSEMETQSLSTSEEDETKEFDSDLDDSKDLDYVPPICLRAGGALKKRIEIDKLPEVSIEETVLDQPDSSDKQEVIAPPVTAMVVTEEDVLDKPASIVYHHVLKQLLDFVRLPIDICKAKDSVTKEPCNAAAPFEVSVKRRCTAVNAEWICPNGHTVWRWTSQRYFKYGMLAGDFMLGCNILLSGNNYRNIALMFKFMNMGIMDPATYYKIQDGFCVDNIKAFWKSTKQGIINELKTKESIVLLGDARIDSPGFCAQYCTYTMMENDSKKIVHTFSTDKRYTQRNSVIMEKACFIKCIDAISQELISLTDISTVSNG
uniref:Uncharacterized protein n=1 Tax=Neogobius melanostomus TaxID=47308 RepID=A0A8C6UNC1_9GOBI